MAHAVDQILFQAIKYREEKAYHLSINKVLCIFYCFLVKAYEREEKMGKLQWDQSDYKEHQAGNSSTVQINSTHLVLLLPICLRY